MIVIRSCRNCKSKFSTEDYRRWFCSKKCSALYHRKLFSLQRAVKTSQQKIQHYTTKLNQKQSELSKIIGVK